MHSSSNPCCSSCGDEYQVEIFRVKGVVAVAGSDSKWAVQGVHELFDVSESSVHKNPSLLAARV